MWSRMFSHLAVGVLWVVHFLPFGITDFLGRRFGSLLYYLASRRRKIAEVNVAWCFPELSSAARRQLVKDCFRSLGRSVLDRGILWWGSPERIRRLITVVGEEKIQRLLDEKRPVILFVSHFFGLDAGAMAMSMRFDVVTIYAPQRNPVFERLFVRGRGRFGNQLMLTRQDGVRATVKAMKSGRPFYYLPDLNYRRRDSIFVPFFGIKTATIDGLSRLSKAAGAAVVPCVTRMLPGGQGYRVEINDPWTEFPTADVEADTARMNAWIEQTIRTMPEQYFWVHRRFKTRPPGERRPY